jgi:hypothetical protein
VERVDVISLAREIMASCESFNSVPAVTVSKGIEPQSWFLSVNWTPHHSESECLARILKERGFEAVKIKESTIFRAKQKA